MIHGSRRWSAAVVFSWRVDKYYSILINRIVCLRIFVEI